MGRVDGGAAIGKGGKGVGKASGQKSKRWKDNEAEKEARAAEGKVGERKGR